MVDTGEDKTIPVDSVLLALDDSRLQEKILLNLARCLSMLGDSTASLRQRSAYLKASVLASSMALVIVDHHEENSASRVTALLLRSKTQTKLAKYAHALADVKEILRTSPQHQEALRQQQEIQRLQIRKEKADRKLVKEVCGWVNKATKNDAVSSDSAEPTEMREESVDESIVQRKIPWLIPLLIVCIAILLQTLSEKLR